MYLKIPFIEKVVRKVIIIFIMKRKFKQGWSTIPQITTKRIAEHKKATTYGV